MRLTSWAFLPLLLLSMVVTSVHAQQVAVNPGPGSVRSLTEDQIQTYWSYAKERIGRKDFRTAMATLYFLLNAEGLSDTQREEVDKTLLDVLRISKEPAVTGGEAAGSVLQPPVAEPSAVVELIDQEVPVGTLEQVSFSEVAPAVDLPAAPTTRVPEAEAPATGARATGAGTVGETTPTLILNESNAGIPAENRQPDSAGSSQAADDQAATLTPPKAGTESPVSTLSTEKVTETDRVETAVVESQKEAAEVASADVPAVRNESDTDTQYTPEQGLDSTDSTQTVDDTELTGPTDISIELSFSREDTGNSFTEFDEGTVSDVSTGLSVDFYHTFSPLLSGYLELELPIGESGSSVETGEFWLQLDLSGSQYWADITIGTQSTFDSRGWMFDSTLDLISAGVSSDHSNLRFGLGIETQYSFWSDFFEPEGDTIYRWMAEYSQQIREAHQLSVLLSGLKDDAANEDNIEADINWLGLRASGTVGAAGQNQLSYWADIGFVSGDEKNFELAADDEGVSVLQALGETSVRGSAYDLGVTWWSNFPGSPQFTVAIAGTSDDADLQDNKEQTYRQTGLHSNSADIGSASGLSYYGLALNPELSNLEVRSAGVGFPVKSASYLMFMYHDYRQVSLATELRDSALDLTLDGQDKHIGDALDVVFAYEESEVWSASLSIGFFEAGKGALPESSSAFYGLVDFSYSF